MKKLNENIIIASNETGLYPYRSFSRFCKTVGIDRTKFRTVPDQVETPYGIFDIEKLPMNVSMDCHQIRNLLCKKFTVISGSVKHKFVAKNGNFFTVVTNAIKTEIISCKLSRKEIDLDESTAELILSKIQ